MTRIIALPLLLATVIALAPLPTGAVNPDEALADPALEAQARALSAEIRCLVCQNQSIDESDADLAKDLRRLIRARLAAGESEAQIRDYLVSRYGEFVLLRPPMRGGTWLLWFGPLVVFLAGAAGLVIYLRRRSPPLPSGAAEPGPARLSAAERARLDELLGDDGSRG